MSDPSRSSLAGWTGDKHVGDAPQDAVDYPIKMGLTVALA